ncbi:hypothetical protein OG978_32360 [Streptomyces sp. NBC_01591]|uniref:hypothetical protein n=1 Tax=Streptomyces sp. NBC_01591 TaxID=2975888 RepID=UPI002DDA4017|nr:hypothetical protein [Streptomyces sp. NBC_01591]WSD71667.1 hypothetical protein OG978_32360 [Streptomyces sp. NBC_01591]
MNARNELYAVLRAAGEDRAEAERLIAARDAEVLTEAAAVIVAENDRVFWATTPGTHWAADLLRRMADKAVGAAQLARLEDARHTLQQNRQGGAL